MLLVAVGQHLVGCLHDHRHQTHLESLVFWAFLTLDSEDDHEGPPYVLACYGTFLIFVKDNRVYRWWTILYLSSSILFFLLYSGSVLLPNVTFDCLDDTFPCFRSMFLISVWLIKSLLGLVPLILILPVHLMTMSRRVGYHNLLLDSWILGCYFYHLSLNYYS